MTPGSVTLCLTGLMLALIGSCGASPFTYECRDDIMGKSVGKRCVKTVYDESDMGEQLSLMSCKMICGKYGTLWPQPTGHVDLSKDLFNFLPNDLNVSLQSFVSVEVEKMLDEFVAVFAGYLQKLHPDYHDKNNHHPFGNVTTDRLTVTVMVDIRSNDTSLTMDTNESYTLTAQLSDGLHGDVTNLDVRIAALTYFGARHGLETFSQMITFNDLTESLQTYRSATVLDKPVYSHRGFMLDTSRNYFSMEDLKTLVDGLSYNKMNVFHWHITDSHSFPLVLKTVPELSEFGAYSKRKVYTERTIRQLIHYSRVRGVRIVPEFDAPAHAGNGWQFAEKRHPEWGPLALCINHEQWHHYCVEPPCGQLNVINERMYDVLANVYKDMFRAFEPDVFHFGGDEVNLNCWNSSQEIQNYLTAVDKEPTEANFYELWSQFQKRARELVLTANGDRPITGIVWTSALTKDNIEAYLPKEEYIIQLWAASGSAEIKALIDKGYRTIFSNYDVWYLDCGYDNWVGMGNNWCSPYKGWKEMYENNPKQIYRQLKGINEPLLANILGGEACMWSEQVQGDALHTKAWPRTSAIAERLWSDPATGWIEAEARLIHMRERMTQRGVPADALQPEWCHQNEALCNSREEEVSGVAS